MKLTKEQIKEIKELSKEKNSYELAKLFNVSQNTIMYWISNRDKQIIRNKNYVKNLSKERKHKLYLRQKEYQKIYFMNRYRTNEVFRNKVKERAKEYKRKKNDR